MIIDVKQGVGRLIRTASDTGVMAILDSRARASRYGRELVLPSLPPARLSADIFEVGNFYQRERQRVLDAQKPKPEPKPEPVRILSSRKFTEDSDGMLWA
jgi:hypothetical protein